MCGKFTPLVKFKLEGKGKHEKHKKGLIWSDKYCPDWDYYTLESGLNNKIYAFKYTYV